MISTDFEIDLQDPDREPPPELDDFCWWVFRNSCQPVEIGIYVDSEGLGGVTFGFEESNSAFRFATRLVIDEDHNGDVVQAAWDEILKQIREAEPCPDV